MSYFFIAFELLFFGWGTYIIYKAVRMLLSDRKQELRSEEKGGRS